MKKNNLFVYIILCLLIVSMVLPVSVNAEGIIDTSQDVTLNLLCLDQDVPLTGVTFDIYYVADMSADGNFTLAGDFAKYPVLLNKNMDDIAFTLLGYALRDKVTPTDSGKTNDEGELTFPNQAERLGVGLYLVAAKYHVQNETIYIGQPILVSLPSYDEAAGRWIGNVTAKMKFETYAMSESRVVERKVLKIWDDEGLEVYRPEEITVYLLQDGLLYDSAKLSEANNWKHTWLNLEEAHCWVVVEEDLEKDYTVLVTQEGQTFTITNTCHEDPPPPDKPDEPELPNTGLLWWPVPVLIAIGLLLILVGTLRRRKSAYEE